MVLAAAVSSGVVTAVQAWPEFFDVPGDQGDSGAFPSTDADLSDFEVEHATPESFAADMEALVRASQHITIREEAAPEPPSLPGGLPDTEWTLCRPGSYGRTTHEHSVSRVGASRSVG